MLSSQAGWFTNRRAATSSEMEIQLIRILDAEMLPVLDKPTRQSNGTRGGSIGISEALIHRCVLIGGQQDVVQDRTKGF